MEMTTAYYSALICTNFEYFTCVCCYISEKTFSTFHVFQLYSVFFHLATSSSLTLAWPLTHSLFCSLSHFFSWSFRIFHSFHLPNFLLCHFLSLSPIFFALALFLPPLIAWFLSLICSLSHSTVFISDFFVVCHYIVLYIIIKSEARSTKTRYHKHICSNVIAILPNIDAFLFSLPFFLFLSISPEYVYNAPFTLSRNDLGVFCFSHHRDFRLLFAQIRLLLMVLCVAQKHTHTHTHGQ